MYELCPMQHSQKRQVMTRVERFNGKLLSNSLLYVLNTLKTLFQFAVACFITIIACVLNTSLLD